MGRMYRPFFSAVQYTLSFAETDFVRRVRKAMVTMYDSAVISTAVRLTVSLLADVCVYVSCIGEIPRATAL